MRGPIRREGEGELPPFFVPGRRTRLAGLVGIGVLVALLSAATARLVSLLSREHDPQAGITLAAGLLALIVATGGLRVLERRLAEALGQDYVHEIRMELMRAALGPGHGPSLGITIARTSNDLNSVRNWITFGLAGVVSGVPLILVLTAVLWMMSPTLAAAVIGPLLGAVVFLAFLSRPTFSRAAALRRVRGRLAGQVTDTINAVTAVRAGGGEERELGRIDRLGQGLAVAAVRRATLAGSLRASAMGAASAAAVAVAAAGAFGGLNRGLVAAGLMVVSMIAGPVHDLGRLVEYRQSFRAARRSIAPALPRTPSQSGTSAEPGDLQERTPDVTIKGRGAEEFGMPALAARAGELVRIEGLTREAADDLFESLLGVAGTSDVLVTLGGMDLFSADASLRRRYVGYAACGLQLERGQLIRAIRYRRPDAEDPDVADAIAHADLKATIARLPKGAGTVLRRGGEPLTAPERAKVQLARAILGKPPLLLLNRIDADLDPSGFRALQDLLRRYPGVTLISTDNPSVLPSAYRRWCPAGQSEPLPVP